MDIINIISFACFCMALIWAGMSIIDRDSAWRWISGMWLWFACTFLFDFFIHAHIKDLIFAIVYLIVAASIAIWGWNK